MKRARTARLELGEKGEISEAVGAVEFLGSKEEWADEPNEIIANPALRGVVEEPVAELLVETVEEDDESSAAESYVRVVKEEPAQPLEQWADEPEVVDPAIRGVAEEPAAAPLVETIEKNVAEAAVSEPHVKTVDEDDKLLTTESRTSLARGQSRTSLFGEEFREGSRMSLVGEGSTESKEMWTDSLQGVFPLLIGQEESPAKYDFLQDSKNQMTWGRRIAMRLKNYGWYNPREVAWKKEKIYAEKMERGRRASRLNLLGDPCADIETRPRNVTRDEQPLLEKGWAFFEHMTLSRHIVEEDSASAHQLTRAEPGDDENPTRLYHPVCTPPSQMGDFGLGIGIYFTMLRGVFVLTLLAGLINIPNMIYYASDEYSDGQVGVDNLLRGSAICTRTIWVPCPTCKLADFESTRVATTSVSINETDSTLIFALRNDCHGVTLEQGLISFGTLLLMGVGMLLIGLYEDHEEVKFDEDEQTAQDYSIVIENPPPDAFDPAEWREFFHKEFNGAHATVITVALDNDLLIQTLVKRRELMQRISLLVEPGTSLDILTLARLALEASREQGYLQKIVAKLLPGVPELFRRIAVAETEIMGLAQLDYSVYRVFVSFEYEEDQRAVLSSLSVSPWQLRNQHKNDWSPLFRGQHLLSAREPEEPNDISWVNMNVKVLDLLKAMVTTVVFAGVTIVLIALMIDELHNEASPTAAAISISITNVIFPQIAKLLTMFERHASESDKQTSLYFKIAIFRWVNTAIIISVIVPFTRTITNHGLLQSIYAIFFADIVTSNVIQLADIPGHFQRHYLAPRAPSQDVMYSHMKGQDFELAERFTNITKILFLTFWYSSLYPATFFLCALSVLVSYFADRFSLMRTWARQPMVGTSIARFSRRYFFTTALVAMAIVSGYNWSGFPYDNLCAEDEKVATEYIGNYTAEVHAGGQVPVDVEQGDSLYRFCNQDLRRHGRGFPPNPRFQPESSEWMTAEQERLVGIFGWTSLALLVFVASSLLFIICQAIESYFHSRYEPTGKDQHIPFSEAQSISSYIPQVNSRLFNYPLVATSTQDIDPDLYDWQDPYRPHRFYDMTEDALEIIRHIEGVRDKHVFSVVSHVKAEHKRESWTDNLDD